MKKEDRFSEEDVPLILAAVKNAQESKEAAQIVITISQNGGVMGIEMTKKKKWK